VNAYKPESLLSHKRDRFESNAATRLHGTVGLYSGWRLSRRVRTWWARNRQESRRSGSWLFLRERHASMAFCPFQAPARARSCHPVLDHGTARRRHDACPDGQARRHVHVVRPPAPVVVEHRADVGARLPYRSPELPLLARAHRRFAPARHLRDHRDTRAITTDHQQQSEDYAAGIGGCPNQRELQRDTDTDGCVVSIGISSNKSK
jgi:hypothetical protein